MFIGLLGFASSVSFSLGADIETNFESFSGFTTGQSTFTLRDDENSNFSLTATGDGQIVFFRDPSLYFSNSNRSFGVTANNQATLVFTDLPASEVTVWVQDTNGDNDNENGGVLGDANGEVEAFDTSGTSLGIFEFPEDSFGEFTFSSDLGIASLEFTNETFVTGSWSLLGAISARAVPEPVSPAWFLGCLAFFVVRQTASTRRR